MSPLLDVFGGKEEGVVFLRSVALEQVDLHCLNGLRVATSRSTPVFPYLGYLGLGRARPFLYSSTYIRSWGWASHVVGAGWDWASHVVGAGSNLVL